MHVIADFFEETNAAQDDLINIYRHETDVSFTLSVKGLECQENSKGGKDI
jgi:hypothetical protein